MKKLNVASVQFKWKIDDYISSKNFYNRIDCIVENIRKSVDNSEPLFISFPEDIGIPMLLFGEYTLIKDKDKFSSAVNSLILSHPFNVISYKTKYDVSSIRALLLSKSYDMEKNYTSIFSKIAKKYNAYIVAGSIALPDSKLHNGKYLIDGKSVYNVSFFFGPDGNLIGKQKKVYLVDFEGKSGFDLEGGSLDELKVFETPFGKVSIAICFDGFKEDVLKKLSDMGTDILVQPSANNKPWNKWQQGDWMGGMYHSVYENKKFKYSVNPMMNGNILDLSFEGQSSIISSTQTGTLSSYSLLKPVEGFVKVAKHHNTEEVLISQIEI